MGTRCGKHFWPRAGTANVHAGSEKHTCGAREATAGGRGGANFSAPLTAVNLHPATRTPLTQTNMVGKSSCPWSNTNSLNRIRCKSKIRRATEDILTHHPFFSCLIADCVSLGLDSTCGRGVPRDGKWHMSATLRPRLDHGNGELVPISKRQAWCSHLVQTN
jgi:hypothetical protein